MPAARDAAQKATPRPQRTIKALPHGTQALPDEAPQARRAQHPITRHAIVRAAVQ